MCLHLNWTWRTRLTVCSWHWKCLHCLLYCCCYCCCCSTRTRLSDRVERTSTMRCRLYVNQHEMKIANEKKNEKVKQSDVVLCFLLNTYSARRRWTCVGHSVTCRAPSLTSWALLLLSLSLFHCSQTSASVSMMMMMMIMISSTKMLRCTAFSCSCA